MTMARATLPEPGPAKGGTGHGFEKWSDLRLTVAKLAKRQACSWWLLKGTLYLRLG